VQKQTAAHKEEEPSMAVRKIDSTVADSRKNVTMPNEPTRIDPMKLKLGKQVARQDPR
jgi:hypothetical protein